MEHPSPAAHLIAHSKLPAAAHHWFRDIYLWLPLALLSWWLAYRLRDPFISDWDGFDYTYYTVQGLPSALGLSRALFLGYNHWLWRLLNWCCDWPPEQAFLLLRYGAIAQAGLATTGFYALYKELSASRLTAWLSALLMAAAPYYIIYSGRAMSEIPAFLWLSWALWWLARSARRQHANQYLLAALLVGASANLREFAVFYFPLIPFVGWVYRLAWWRWIVALALAGSAAVTGMIFWALYDTDNYLRAVTNWYRLSAHERAVHPVTRQNFAFLARFSFEGSAVTTLLGAPGLLLKAVSSGRSVLFGLGLCGLAANLVMLLNHDLPVNPRYMLTGLLGLAGVSGWLLAELLKTQRWRCLPVLLGLVVLTKGSYNYMAKELYDNNWAAHAAKNYLGKVADLPWNAAFIVGARTPLIHFYSGIGARPHWAVIPPGAGWPDEKLGQRIDHLILAGRVVYVDFDPELWQVGARAKSREAAGLEMIKREYELELVRDQLYRIIKRRPFEHLQALQQAPAGKFAGNFLSKQACEAAVQPERPKTVRVS